MRLARQQYQHPRHSPSAPRRRPESGALLLEVLIALALFVFAAAVISSGLSSAVDRTLRLREQAHALDLAVSVVAEVEMGLRPARNAGPEPFDPPFETWTWQVEASPYSFGGGEVAGLQTVTAIVRNGAQTTVQRLTQLIPAALPPPGPDEPGGAFPDFRALPP